MNRADSDRLGASMPSRRSRYYNRATIRRDRLAEDGFRTLNPLGPYLKGHIQITFINECVYKALQGISRGNRKCRLALCVVQAELMMQVWRGRGGYRRWWALQRVSDQVSVTPEALKIAAPRSSRQGNRS